jgi:hypothetical protein
MVDLTVDRLRELLSYDTDTGKFTWLVRRSSKAFPGDEAGSIQTAGYRQIVVDRRTYVAHRLAWFYHFGEWPADQLDHINGIRDDNRIANLRPANQHVNNHNAARRPDASSGARGVAQYKLGKWRAHITVYGTRLHLGVFRSLEEAVRARRWAEDTLLGDFAPPNLARPEYPNTRPLKKPRRDAPINTREKADA